MQPRGYQLELIESLRAAYKQGYRAPLLVLPTGGGKTFVGSWITKTALAKPDACVWILVHREELLNQWTAALERIGVHPALVSPNHPTDPHAPCQVASVQTLANRLEAFTRKPSLIIVDEAHHAPARTWGKVMGAFPEARILGVTATPCRRDGKGLRGMFDVLVEGASVRQLIELGYLVEPTIFAPPAPDLSGVTVRGGDFQTEKAAEVMDKPTITGDAITHYRKWADGLPAVVFCVDVKHARRVAEAFAEAGYSAACVDGTMDKATRAATLAGLADGTVQVVTSCDVISEGTDIPSVAVVILLRPTHSLSLYLQQIGRGLRPAPGKDRAIVLDHAGNFARHGWPDEPRGWSLDGVKKREKKKGAEDTENNVKQCLGCYAVHKPTLKVCPHCGYEYPVKPTRKLRVVDGELVPLTRENMAERFYKAVGLVDGDTPEKPEKKPKLSDEQRARERLEEESASSYRDFLKIEVERGYVRGWAYRRWNARKQATAKRLAEKKDNKQLENLKKFFSK